MKLSMKKHPDFPVPTGSSFTLEPSSSHTDNDIGETWCLPSTSFGIGDFGTPGSENESCPIAVALSSLSVGDIIVSEIMHSPSKAADYKGEWFEIANRTPYRVNLNGLIVRGEGGESFQVEEDVFVESYGYVVLLSVLVN